MATYGALLWTGLDILSLPQTQTLGKQAVERASPLRSASAGVSCLTFLTVLSGALVAGNDAGRAYNTWPKMGDEWIPSDILHLVPWERNVVENTATVQFNHRMLGTATAISALSLAYVGLTRPASSLIHTPQVRRGLYAVGITASAQFALGVTTLVHYVPISLAALHQLGSVAVFTSGVYLTHALRSAGTAVSRKHSPKAFRSAPAAIAR